jgi:hypothetical protein
MVFCVHICVRCDAYFFACICCNAVGLRERAESELTLSIREQLAPYMLPRAEVFMLPAHF